MGVCDSCFASSGESEPEYEAVGNSIPSSGTKIANEKTSLLQAQSYQQQGSSQQAPKVLKQIAAAPINNQHNIAPSSNSQPTPPALTNIVPAPPVASQQQVVNVENVHLRNVVSVAPPVAVAQPSGGAPSVDSSSSAPVARPPVVPTVQQQQSQGAVLAYDPSSAVFEGLELLQKFTNKSSYDTRFIWISIQTNTMHMSQYMTKDRRHKEASLSEVTSIDESPPQKFKSTTPVDSKLCLTINFKRGGGIDLMFKRAEDRAQWTQVLRRIIQSNSSQSGPSQ